MRKYSSAGFARKSVAALMAASLVASLAPGIALADTQSGSNGSAVLLQAASTTIDSSNLQDGTYTVNFTMLNAADPSRSSMSDGAIEKPLTLDVSNGSYTATIQMQGLTIWGSKGYLRNLWYLSGGSYSEATVNSYYTDVIDSFNQNSDGSASYYYPKSLSFPLVNKDKGDNSAGYVELQVFVPIMESISAGSGTQRVYMSIDWSTLQRVGGSDPMTPVTPTDPTTPTDDSRAQIETARNALNSTISAARAISNANGTYTTTSFAALTDAIAAAETTAANSSATADQLNAAVQSVSSAQAGLVRTADVERQASLDTLNSTISSAKAISNADGSYSAESFKALTDAISAGERTAASSSATKSELDAAAKAITDARSGLVASAEATRRVAAEALSKAISDAKAISNSDGTYTAASFKTLSDAIESAEKVAANSSATTDQLNEAAQSVSSAQAGLVRTADAERQASLDALSAAVKDAKAISNASGTYTAASFKALSDAISTGEKVAADTSSSKSEIDAAAKAVSDARSGLVTVTAAERQASAEALAKALSSAKAISNASGAYTSESFKALTDAIASAEKVAANSSTTKSELDAATKAVNDAKAGLTTPTEAARQASVESLTKTISEAKAISNTDGTYTEASFKTLSNVIKAAERVASNEYATKAQLESTEQAVTKTKDALVTTRSVSLEALNETIASAKAVSNADGIYSDESYQALQDAIASAEGLAADNTSTAKQLDAAAAAVADAQNGLARATKATVDGVSYELSYGGASVTGASSDVTAVTIPATVKIGGVTYKVTDVKADAFAGNKKLARVTIGKNVVTIGARAFKGCSKLKTVTFKGRAVTVIGAKAFSGIAKNVTFKAPSGKKAGYKKLLKRAGAPKGFKVK